jgi:hypothetical protein
MTRNTKGNEVNRRVPNPIAPDRSQGHPVLDELVDVGGMEGTTIRQMREQANLLLLNGVRTSVEGGLAEGVIFLVDRIERLTNESE